MKTHPESVYRLTLLWAFAESGLGGLLHGFKLPVTGFVLGAFAVIIISLIARIALNPARDIVQATLLVVAIKFAVSPHSPAPAYIAVIFQGMLGALIFRYSQHLVAVILFSVLALLESAFQKPAIATLIFGKELWIALDELMIAVGFTSRHGFSSLLLLIYFLVYSVWGVLVGIWTFQLPRRLKNLNVERADRLHELPTSFGRWLKKLYLLLIVFLVMAIIGVYLVNQTSPWFYIVRTFVIVLFLYFIVAPLIRIMLQRMSKDRLSTIDEYYTALPAIRQNVQWAYSVALREKQWWKRADVFVLTLIWITVWHED